MLGYRTLCLWRGVIRGPFSSPSAAGGGGGHVGKGPQPHGGSLGTGGWKPGGNPLCLLEPTKLCSVSLALLVGGVVVPRRLVPRRLALWVPGQRRHTVADGGEFLPSAGRAAGLPPAGRPCSWAV